MRVSAFKNCPVKRVGVLILLITFFIGSFITLFTKGKWYINYLYTFTFTTACSFFCTLLLCSFYEKISKYGKPHYYFLFFILVALGTLLGTEIASLILFKRLLIQAPIFIFTLLVSLVASIIMTSYELFRKNLEDKISRLKEAELENERLKRYELEARLTSLQAKLNPHFLFNMLNTTAALVFEDPHKAETTIVRLSDLYRKVLSISSQTFISVGEEIELIEDYLELEKLRFDENLSYHIECPDGLKNKKIPGLLIEPLVENAIKHCLEQSRNALKIEIAIEEKENNLLIEVRDNGPGFELDKTNRGFGLFSIQERLRLLFGEDYGFDVNSTKGEGTRVKIRIPLEAV